MFSLMGSDLPSIIKNIKYLYLNLLSKSYFPNINSPKFQCSKQKTNSIYLRYDSSVELQIRFLPFFRGFIKGSAERIFNMKKIKIIPIGLRESNKNYVEFKISWESNSTYINTSTQLSFGLDGCNLGHLYPFHIIFDDKMNITQIGPSFQKIISNPKKIFKINKHMKKYFTIISPSCANLANFKSIMSLKNTEFILSYKFNNIKNINFRGEMIWNIKEEKMCFIGAPEINYIEEAIFFGISIDDLSERDRNKIFINGSNEISNEISKEISIVRSKSNENIDKKENKNRRAMFARNKKKGSMPDFSFHIRNRKNNLINNNDEKLNNLQSKSADSSPRDDIFEPLTPRNGIKSDLVNPKNYLTEIKYSNKDKNLLELKKFLIEDASDKQFYFINEILNLKINENIELSLYNAIVKFYYEVAEINNLISIIFKNQIIVNSANMDLLFREDCLATKLYKCFITNGKFIDYVDFCSAPLKSSFLANKILEIDPKKMKEGDNIEQNAAELCCITQKLLQNIFGHPEQCPDKIKFLLYSIANEIKLVFPGKPEMNKIIVGNLLFLRFLNPLIILNSSNRNIALICIKTINNLINKIKFGVKESFMEPMNEIINNNNILLLDTFLDAIINPSNIIKTKIEKNKDFPINYNMLVSMDVIKNYILDKIVDILKICEKNQGVADNFYKFLSGMISNINTNLQ